MAKRSVRKPAAKKPPVTNRIPLMVMGGQKNQYDVEPNFDFIKERSFDSIMTAVKAKKTDVVADIVEVNRYGTKRVARYDTAKFTEAVKKNNRRFRESGNFGINSSGASPGLVGKDFVPLLGGPFNKQQYLQDYLQGQAESFFAFHHDPFARAAGNIIKHFTLGKGYRADCENKSALALWKAFEEANDLQTLMGYAALEFYIQGEVMVYWIPDGETYISYQNPVQLQPQKGLIPRIRLLDTSAIWEIITLPEDIQKVFAYQQVYISQYNQYSTKVDGAQVPISKTIIRQIPADQVDHWKVNCISGEKRGRSDLYPVLGFLKRLRDVIQYTVIQAQKHAAYSFDTSIEGSDADLRAYSDALKALGEMPEAGSEFIHTSKVTREMKSPASHGSQSTSFEWTLSCVAAGLGIPVSYFGTHLSAGSTRASAMIATEPSTKKFEDRQDTYKNMLRKMARRMLDANGFKDADIEFTFPELITADRSTKLADLALAQEAGWIPKQQAAEIAAKELGIHDFKFKEIPADQTAVQPPVSPLTAPPRPSGVTSGDRRSAKDQNT